MASEIASPAAIESLLNVTVSVPYLATSIHETIAKADLVLITRQQCNALIELLRWAESVPTRYDDDQILCAAHSALYFARFEPEADHARDLRKNYVEA